MQNYFLQHFLIPAFMFVPSLLNLFNLSPTTALPHGDVNILRPPNIYLNTLLNIPMKSQSDQTETVANLFFSLKHLFFCVKKVYNILKILLVHIKCGYQGRMTGGAEMTLIRSL